jgi:hypothetical protein
MNTHIATRSRFPQVAVVALAAVIAVAFARTYYLKVFFGLPPLSQAAHIHGLISTLWLALHYTQARLIAAHRVALHKRLGIFTAGVGAVLAVQAFDLAVTGVAAGHAPPGRDPLQFLSVPMGTTLMFVLFLGAALALRRRREWHKRLMLLATMALLVPAAGRFDSLIMVPLGLPRALIAFCLTLAFIVWGCVNDWRKTGRIHPAYVVGGTALLISIPARRALGFTDAWIPVAKWLIGQ